MRNRFYELYQFFGGYFHQDWVLVLGTKDWRLAVQNFLDQNSPERVRAVTTQLGMLLSLGLDEEQLAAAMSELGSDVDPAPKSHEAWAHEIHEILREAVRIMRSI